MARNTEMERDQLALVRDASPNELTTEAAPLSHKQYKRRRTFAIISHPDAGKTTLTEQLLLGSGAIRLAGQVRARGQRRRTRSDWMEIERTRGISVTSSIMTFELNGLVFNLLDTPGHADFSEDTYRTLTAVDSAIMVLDAAKGIEAQTLKLFEVCRLRDIPIATFINKVDREGLDPLELLDEIAEKLTLEAVPLTWPIGMGSSFRGCFDLENNQLIQPDGKSENDLWPNTGAMIEACSASGDQTYLSAVESLKVAQAVLPPFDVDGYRAGQLTPVFFGSALSGVGVHQLLAALERWAPEPQHQPATPEPIDPDGEETTGFVFKVQANMDRNHRDRVAFVRLCSGTFRRGMRLRNARTGKETSVANPMFFFGEERSLVGEAVAGDVIGIPNHGTLDVGDTLTEGSLTRVSGIRDFAPEIVRRILLKDVSKAKQLAKGLADMAAEGVAQSYQLHSGPHWLAGVVGPLQLDVLAVRLSAEYGVEVSFENSGYDAARWVTADDPERLESFVLAHRSQIAHDRAGVPIFLARNAWDLRQVQTDNPTLHFSATMDRS